MHLYVRGSRPRRWCAPGGCIVRKTRCGGRAKVVALPEIPAPNLLLDPPERRCVPAQSAQRVLVAHSIMSIPAAGRWGFSSRFTSANSAKQQRGWSCLAAANRAPPSGGRGGTSTPAWRGNRGLCGWQGAGHAESQKDARNARLRHRTPPGPAAVPPAGCARDAPRRQQQAPNRRGGPVQCAEGFCAISVQ